MWERNPRELFNPQENTPKSRNHQTDTKIPSAICLQRNQKKSTNGRGETKEERKKTYTTYQNLSF